MQRLAKAKQGQVTLDPRGAFVPVPDTVLRPKPITQDHKPDLPAGEDAPFLSFTVLPSPPHSASRLNYVGQRKSGLSEWEDE